MLAGRTMDEVGRDAFAGDLLGPDRAASFATLVDKACAAAEALDDPARTVHCSQEPHVQLPKRLCRLLGSPNPIKKGTR
jgi:hypothetical protein